MSFFEYMMRHAAPVLFWASVLIFFGGLATYLLFDRALSSYGSEAVIDPRALVTAIFQALDAAVWPFTGAGIIWTLQRRKPAATEPEE